MGLKPTVICNLSYKRVGQQKGLRDLAKYLQFRDGSIRRDAYLRGEGYGGPEVSDHVRPSRRPPKWVDRGMGESYSQIVNHAHDLRGRSVLARTWVISPDPELMAHIPEDLRLHVMQRVTERTVEFWYDDNGWGTPEYSYVLHDRQTNDAGKQQVHAHIITPGTIPLEPDLGRVDHIVKKPHIRDLLNTSQEVFEQELERTLGRDRAQQVLLERDERLMDEKYPNRYRYEQRRRMSMGRDVIAVMSLLQAERQQKRHKKHRTANLSLYRRYRRRDEQLARQQAWEQRRVRWQTEQRAALEQARRGELERQERLREARQRKREQPAQELPQHLDGPGLELGL
jgi:hypothetical protein